jgi:hypothetical protein
MLIRDLNGIEHNWNLTGYISKGRLLNKSSLHLKAREIIIETFPTLQVLEEVPAPIRKSETLYLDFYLPLKRLCIEVHGEQHFKFIPFYHNNMLSFLKSQKRDRDKTEWCAINNINQIIFGFDEDSETWKNKISNEQ